MRIVSYTDNDQLRPGLLVGDLVVDAARAAGAAGVAGLDSGSSRSLLQAHDSDRSAVAAAADRLAADGGEGVRALDQVSLGPPVPDPEKIICLGLNYRAHADEAGADAPTTPILFAKFRNALAGHSDPIVLPAASDQVDYEAELAIVIGRRCKDVAAADALDVVAGAMAFNDVSARDLQRAGQQWLPGKGPDTFAPCGPALVTLDELPDLQSLQVGTRLNGEVMQSGNTAQMIFPIAETIEFITGLITLEPGDIIATGTPEGVGAARDPQVFLRDGDVVEIEVEGVGTLRNTVAAATS